MFRMTSFWPHLQHPCWFTKPTKDSSVDLIASDIPVALNLRYPFQQRKNDLGGVGVNDIDYYTICNDQIPHGFAVTDSATCNMDCDEGELVNVDDAYKGRRAPSLIFSTILIPGLRGVMPHSCALPCSKLYRSSRILRQWWCLQMRK